MLISKPLKKLHNLSKEKYEKYGAVLYLPFVTNFCLCEIFSGVEISICKIVRFDAHTDFLKKKLYRSYYYSACRKI
jgi:hypothetical protein